MKGTMKAAVILAAVPETYYTAYNSLLNLKICGSDEVLVRGATSGVGIAFLKLLKGKYPEISVTGTSRSEKKREKLLDAGFDHVVLDHENILQTELCYDRVLDLISPAAADDTFSHMKEGGIVCITGLLGGVWTMDHFDPLEDLPENSYLTSVKSKYVNEQKMNQMLEYVQKYQIDVRPEKIFTLEQIREAHAYLDSRQSFGKVVVVL